MRKQSGHDFAGGTRGRAHPGAVALLSLLAATLLAAPAIAGGKAKAELVCGYTASGDAEMIQLPAKALKRIDGVVGCAVRVLGVPDPGAGITVAIQTKRKSVDPESGKKVAVTGPEHSEVLLDVGEESKPMMADLKLVDAKGAGDFEKCVSFDIVATVTNDYSKVLWKKKLKIKQICPKPKPLKAKLTCSIGSSDGTELKLPSPLKPRLSDAVRCVLVSADERLNGADVAYQTSWDSWESGTKTKKTGEPHKAEGKAAEGDKYLREFQLELGDFEMCSGPTVLRVTATDAEGLTLFKTKQTYKQSCPD
jgi:hypothetical protein